MAITLPNKPDDRDFTVKIEKGSQCYVLPLANQGKETAGTNIKTENKAFGHGGIITGFNKINGRNISINCYVEAATEADYLAQMRELKRYVFMGDYRLYIAKNRYFNIKAASKFETKDLPGFVYRRADVDITLIAADPFEYSGYDVRQVINVEDGASFNMENICNVDVPLIVNVEPQGSAIEISLANVTFNRKFTYKAFGVASPAMLTVNTEAGTVTLNGENRINNFGGAFLSLAPGLNQFAYTGSPAQLEIVYKERYI